MRSFITIVAALTALNVTVGPAHAGFDDRKPKVTTKTDKGLPTGTYRDPSSRESSGESRESSMEYRESVISTEADELFEMCVDGLTVIEDVLGYAVTGDIAVTCDGVVDYAMVNFKTSEDRIDHMASWLGWHWPYASGSSCFADSGACYSGCATLPTAAARSLCGLDCSVDLIGCVGGEIVDSIDDSEVE